ncbi:TIR domain-containing adapter molecule 2 [Spea bombifrons]|uniref:TIR domain-containing adapter molecule 2 n=1 Tax=Spea bombifrons TaxID=233779 RepID=UPI00234A29FE|nr:TIR domain-containing adapter molecule 2 [Spea bombifrons]
MMGINHSCRKHSYKTCQKQKNTKIQNVNSTEDSRWSLAVKLSMEKPGEHETTETEEDCRTEDVFYKFVILHAEADISEALRIKNMLENDFSIKPGIIFAELPAGGYVLKTLDNAVNGSAWTILLLTKNFLTETWCEFQSHATLINSINMCHKYNTVIPVRPKKNYLPRENTPFILKLINALEEGSPGFTQQVQKTFQEQRYLKQHALWKAEKASRDQPEQ